MPASDNHVLRLEGVWKKRKRFRRRSHSLKETLIRGLRGQRLPNEEFWALRDLSFTLRRGESIGFCGSNGAGKSTMLRVISRITAPTHGRVTVCGRLAPLLELGTGFLFELSGRDNIVLNGAILGLDDDEMRERMEAIIEFADLGDFIDSPVKTYSSGMYMRLGFAIASHVEADILAIDEVLAVGDAAFEEKCLDWLQQLRQRGASVVVVSHDLKALVSMSDRVIWLEQGGVVADGDPSEIVERYRRNDRPRQEEVG